MSYVLKPREKKNSLFVPIAFVIGIAILLTLFYFFAPNALSRAFTFIAKPFWSSYDKTNLPDRFLDVQSLLEENESLKRALAENEGKYFQSDMILKENEELKKLLGRESQDSFVLAKVLKKPPFSAYDIFVIDIGEKNGVEVGNKVYALGSVIIGEIIESSQNLSKVKLYSSSGEKYEVLIGDMPVVAYGKGGGTFEASVPRDSKIEKGQSVSIPALSRNFLGKVLDIVSEPSDPFSTILFAQPINIYEIQWVEVENTHDL